MLPVLAALTRLRTASNFVAARQGSSAARPDECRGRAAPNSESFREQEHSGLVALVLLGILSTIIARVAQR